MTAIAKINMLAHQRTSAPPELDFLWGVSASSFQVEGAAHIDGCGDSIWNTFCRMQGRVKNGDSGDSACDHYHRYAEEPIVPGAFHDTLLDIHCRFRLPIYVLENGTAADDKLDNAGSIQDAGRITYLHAYTGAMQEAIAAGADVRGYLVWSLLDNFEWRSGYSQRFGPVYIDFATQRRVPEASAHWHADFIKIRRRLEVSVASGEPIGVAAAAEHELRPDNSEQLPAASVVQTQ